MNYLKRKTTGILNRVKNHICEQFQKKNKTEENNHEEEFEIIDYPEQPKVENDKKFPTIVLEQNTEEKEIDMYAEQFKSKKPFESLSNKEIKNIKEDLGYWKIEGNKQEFFKNVVLKDNSNFMYAGDGKVYVSDYKEGVCFKKMYTSKNIYIKNV